MSKKSEQKEWEKLASWNGDPDITAFNLWERGFTSDQYQEIQDKRHERVIFFQSKGINILIQDSQELYNWGCKVLIRLKEYESKVE